MMICRFVFALKHEVAKSSAAKMGETVLMLLVRTLETEGEYSDVT